jgi:hypothetical protein
MADRKVTVNVALNATGNLAQAAGAAAAQAAKLNQATKGAAQIAASAGGFGGFGNFIAPQAPMAAGSQWASAAAAGAQRLRMGIPVAQQAPPTARPWTMQDTLAERIGQRVADAEQRLAYLRSGPGMRATIQATRAETDLARRQEYLTRVATYGRFGAAVETIAPTARMAGIVGAAGMAAAYSGIASASPEAGSQITNSFRMIANEIGIATIPAAVRFTGALQSVARGIRTVNEATGGVAGTLAFNGALLLTGVGALGMAGRAVATTVSGLRSLGLLAEVAAPVAGQLAGQALGAGARRLAGTGGAQAGGQVLAGAGTGAGTSLALGAGPIAIPIATLVAGAVMLADTVHNIHAVGLPGDDSRRPPGMTNDQWAVRQWQNQMPFMSTATNFGQSVANRFGLGTAQPAHGFGAWAAEQLGIGAPGPGQAGAVADVTERRPQLYQSAEEMQTAMMMRIQGEPGALGEQENRATAELAAALRENTQALQANTGTGAALGTWGAPSGENG